MGQIAEDMSDGTTCQWCGMFFEDKSKPKELQTHGYPVVCKGCARGYSNKALEKLGLQRALYPAF